MSVLRMSEDQVEAHKKRISRGRESSELLAPEPVKSLQNNIKTAGEKKPKPEYEKWLHNQLLGAGVLVMELEYKWARGRKYRADIAFPEHRLIVEINGAAHRIKGRFKDDILKHQEAILQGWVLLPVSTAQVRDGTACVLVKRVLALLMANGVPF